MISLRLSYKNCFSQTCVCINFFSPFAIIFFGELSSVGWSAGLLHRAVGKTFSSEKRRETSARENRFVQYSTSAEVARRPLITWNLFTM